MKGRNGDLNFTILTMSSVSSSNEKEQSDQNGHEQHTRNDECGAYSSSKTPVLAVKDKSLAYELRTEIEGFTNNRIRLPGERS